MQALPCLPLRPCSCYYEREFHWMHQSQSGNHTRACTQRRFNTAIASQALGLPWSSGLPGLLWAGPSRKPPGKEAWEMQAVDSLAQRCTWMGERKLRDTK